MRTAALFGSALVGVVLLSSPVLSQKPLKSKTVSAEDRVDALSRASVWQAPPPIPSAQLGADPKQPS
jgi:hypothetical protein